MERYILFMVDINYPIGGWYEWVGEYATIEDAIVRVAKEVGADGHYWWHIVDTVTRKICVEDVTI